MRRHATPETIGGFADHVGPSHLSVRGVEHQLDIVVASAEADLPPAERTITAVGEARSGETVGNGHLRALEQARSSFGPRAAQAKLLLFAPSLSAGLLTEAARRSDVELIDLDRLYTGS